jgi:ParB/RepB/Spo0J family partition protein
MQPVQNTSIQSPEYCDLPIEQLVESPTNPRKRYQQASLEELAQSFRSRGVLEPLLVRPVEPERFEIVAGSRRYRAARIAELQTVPARVREMTDAEALEVQCIENLQREDIHPLEEAQGFRALLDLPDQQYTIARIGERAGKSAAYITGLCGAVSYVAFEVCSRLRFEWSGAQRPHKYCASELAKELHDLRRRCLSCPSVVGAITLLKRPSLHFQIDFSVDLGRIDRYVTQP